MKVLTLIILAMLSAAAQDKPAPPKELAPAVQKIKEQMIESKQREEAKRPVAIPEEPKPSQLTDGDMKALLEQKDSELYRVSVQLRLVMRDLEAQRQYVMQLKSLLAEANNKILLLGASK